MYYNTAQEQQKAKANRRLKQTAEYLAKVEAILRSQRFAKWLEATEARFPWATKDLFDRLMKDLLLQVRFAVDERNLRGHPASAQLKYLSGLCSKVIEKYETRGGFTLKKRDRAFSVPRGKSFSEELYQFLCEADAGFILKDEGDFYLWNALNELVVYTMARETLARPTGNDWFEKFLASLTTDYLLDGFPFDILSFDSDSIRKGMKVEALYVKRSYCSTWTIFEGDKIPEQQTDRRLVRMRKAA